MARPNQLGLIRREFEEAIQDGAYALARRILLANPDVFLPEDYERVPDEPHHR